MSRNSSLKSDKNNGYLVGDQYIFMITSNSFVLRMRKVSDRICTETQNKHIMFNHFFFENRVIYEIVWYNTVEPDRPQMKIWHMLIAGWIPEAANTQPEYAILLACPLQQ